MTEDSAVSDEIEDSIQDGSVYELCRLNHNHKLILTLNRG